MAFYDIYNKCYLWTFFIFAIVETLFCSGITYGWASMVVVFKLEHFYLRLCRPFYKEHNMTFPEEMLATNMSRASIRRLHLELPGCPAQDSIMNLIFTVSIFCLAMIKFPSGMFSDRLGPRVARTVGGILYIGASLGLGFVTVGYENYLFPIFICICMGGSILFVATASVCNVIYRNTKSQVICILHGGFDSSAVVLLIFKELFEDGIKIKYIALMYTAIVAFIILAGSLFLIPPNDMLIHWIEEEKEMGLDNFQESIAGPDFAVSSVGSHKARNHSTISRKSVYESIVSSLGQKIEEEAMNGKKNDHNSNAEYYIRSGDRKEQNPQQEKTPLLFDSKTIEGNPVFEEGSVMSSICTPLFLCELVFLCTFQLKLWSFVGSLNDNLGRLSNNDKEVVSHYTSLFGYIQFCGILVTPLIGVVFDRDAIFGTGSRKPMMTAEEKRLKKMQQCIAPFAITIFLGIVFAALALSNDLRLQIPQYLLYTSVRGFLYANHGSFMAVAFPANQFGTLYGLGIFIAGCVGLLEYPFFRLTFGPLNGDPYYTNVILFILVLFANTHTLYLWSYCRAEERRLKGKMSAC